MAEPDHIASRNDLLKWLDGKSRGWALAIGSRTVLRVLPQIGLGDTGDILGAGQAVWRTVFRAAFVLWSTQRYSTPDISTPNIIQTEAAAAGARKAIDSLVGHFGGSGPRAAAGAIAAIQTFSSSSYNSYVAAAAEEAARAAGPNSADIWASIIADAKWLLHDANMTGPSSNEAAQLMLERLWLTDVRGNSKYRVNFPIWVRTPWDAFKKSGSVKKAGFDIWIRWYEARLKGGDSGFSPLLKGKAAEQLNLLIASQSERFWKRDPTVVNADISRWAEEAAGQPLYNFIMTAKPDAWRAINTEFIRARFLEYTDESIAKRFRSLDVPAISQLLRLPTLFAYESSLNEPAHVGNLVRLEATKGTIDIWFKLDPSIPPITPEMFARIRDQLGLGKLEEYRTHWAIKEIDLYSVLSGAGLLSPETFSEDRFEEPPEPLPGPGPQYRPRNGKLSEDISPPTTDEALRNVGLHNHLKADASTLAANLARVENRYPELAAAARKYSELLAVETRELDVTGIWSVGGALASFARSYSEQNAARTLAEPLEPQFEAQLQNVVRQHGALIMGFGEGRDLVERADVFAVDTARLREIEQPGTVLLNQLTDNRELVDDRTRALHRSIRASVTEIGWTSTRVGYSAYVIVRNGVRAMIKFSIGDNPNAGAILGLLTGASVLGGDPNAEFIRAVVPFLQQHGTQLLAFFNHSPEMRVYVEWALRILDADRTGRERD